MLLVPKNEGLTFLEQLTALALKSCSKKEVPYFWKVDYKAQKVRFVKGTCKQWSCSPCAARNTKKWIARIIDGCNRLDTKWYFCTITAHRKWRGAEASLKNLRANWPKVRKRYARIAEKLGKEFFYVREWEAHKDGSFHMHFATNIKQTKRELKNMAATCGLGFQADSQEAKNAGQVAGYMAKYMLKAMPFATHYPKGARRLEVSNNWVRWKEKDTGWQVVLSLNEAKAIRDSFADIGYELEDLALRNAIKKREEELENESRRGAEDARRLIKHSRFSKRVSPAKTGFGCDASTVKDIPQLKRHNNREKLRIPRAVRVPSGTTATHERILEP